MNKRCLDIVYRELIYRGLWLGDSYKRFDSLRVWILVKAIVTLMNIYRWQYDISQLQLVIAVHVSGYIVERNKSADLSNWALKPWSYPNTRLTITPHIKTRRNINLTTNQENINRVDVQMSPFQTHRALQIPVNATIVNTIRTSQELMVLNNINPHMNIIQERSLLRLYTSRPYPDITYVYPNRTSLAIAVPFATSVEAGGTSLDLITSSHATSHTISLLVQNVCKVNPNSSTSS